MGNTQENLPANGLLDGGWTELQGDELFGYIRDHNGINIPFDDERQFPFVVDAIHKRLNGHFVDTDVLVTANPENPEHFVAQVQLHSND